MSDKRAAVSVGQVAKKTGGTPSPGWHPGSACKQAVKPFAGAAACVKMRHCSPTPWAHGALRSMREILAELTAALDQDRSCVYCSVIETRGSTPQKAGASMLVF